MSDYFDFSIYIDADEADIERWYVERFLKLRETVFSRPTVVLPPLRRPVRRTRPSRPRTSIWREINGKNLAENIEPTRDRASLIMRKEAHHAVTQVQLRKL